MNQVDTYIEAVGCIHIHSVYSDGSGTIPEISDQAEAAGLDYIMITDHNNLRALKNGEEGWYGRVLAVLGYEINDVDDQNHYLAFGLSEELDKNLSAAEYVRQVRLNGGFGIIAHPDEQRQLMPEHPPYPWTEWGSPDYHGIEIWNQMSEWMEGLRHWNKLWRFVHPRKSLRAPLEQTLDRWDTVNRQRRVVGIGGVDAHAYKHSLLGGLIKLTIFRYKVQFKSVRTHLLLKQELQPGHSVEESKKQIFDAILNCRAFVSNNGVGDAEGFRTTVEQPQGAIVPGEELSFVPGTRLLARLPASGRVILAGNGRRLAEASGRQVEFELQGPGLYRLEIFRKDRAWIYTNHFRVMDAK